MGDRRANMQVRAAIYRHDEDGSKMLLQEVENDLAVENFLKFFEALLGASGTTIIDKTLNRKSDAASNTIRFWGSGNQNTAFDNAIAATRCRLLVGDSATTPAITDTKLGNERLGVDAGTPSRVANVITVAGGFIAPSTFTAEEVGLSLNFANTGGVSNEFLMFHDLLSVALTSGIAYSIAYTFTFP